MVDIEHLATNLTPGKSFLSLVINMSWNGGCNTVWHESKFAQDVVNGDDFKRSLSVLAFMETNVVFLAELILLILC